ncbi:hypothetical protein DRH27_05605, partial [Candidatus Falkowbacteria bacterium]
QPGGAHRKTNRNHQHAAADDRARQEKVSDRDSAAASILDGEISFYPNVTDTRGQVRRIRSALDGTRDGKWERQITPIRILHAEDPVGNKAEIAARKRELPGATFSGKFKSRNNDGLIESSGVLVADLDDLSDDQIESLKNRLAQDVHVICSFRSPVNGLKILFRIPDNADFADAFRAVARYLKENYDVDVDPACTDVARLCFVSYDPAIVYREDATPLPVEPAPPPTATTKESGYTGNATTSSSDVTDDEIRNMLSHLPRLDYSDWIKVISAVASVRSPEVAESLLKEWSPEEVPGEYAKKIRHRLADVNIGTLVYIAKEHGYAPGSARKRPERRQAVRDRSDQVETQPRGNNVDQADPDKGQSEAGVDEKFAAAIATMDATRADPANPPPVPRPIYSLMDKTISSPGNITGINAQAKGGKTAVVGAAMAAAIGEGETLGLRSENPEGKAIVHFDTEQSAADHFGVVMTAIRRVDVKIVPGWVRSYSLIGYDPAMRIRLLEFELARAAAECGGIHSVILDGIADFCRNPNDLEEAAALVGRLHALAAKYDTTILAALHTNPVKINGEAGITGRGHLGSELERKAETNLVLHKDQDGVTTIFTERARHCYISKNDGPRFAWADDLGLHEGVDSARQTKAGAKADELRDLTSELFKDGGHIRWTDLIEKIEERGVKSRSAERLVKGLSNGGFIRRNIIGRYESTL